MASPARSEHAQAGTSDEALMLAYASGDAVAFDRLYARHKGGVYRYLLRHCGNAGTADELFQDVWMNVIRVRHAYAPTAKFATWLYRIAHNRIVDHWRATGPANRIAASGDDEEDLLAGVPGPATAEPERMALVRELRDRLSAALAALPPLQRDAFLLHQEGGLALADIATLTGAGVETVKSRLRYASARLRALLGDLR
jgi:RNA polymerase sigma-70 factor (ECF subfamily)